MLFNIFLFINLWYRLAKVVLLLFWKEEKEDYIKPIPKMNKKSSCGRFKVAANRYLIRMRSFFFFFFFLWMYFNVVSLCHLVPTPWLIWLTIIYFIQLTTVVDFIYVLLFVQRGTDINMDTCITQLPEECCSNEIAGGAL